MSLLFRAFFQNSIDEIEKFWLWIQSSVYFAPLLLCLDEKVKICIMLWKAVARSIFSKVQRIRKFQNRKKKLTTYSILYELKNFEIAQNHYESVFGRKVNGSKCWYLFFSYFGRHFGVRTDILHVCWNAKWGIIKRNIATEKMKSNIYASFA